MVQVVSLLGVGVLQAPPGARQCLQHPHCPQCLPRPGRLCPAMPQPGPPATRPSAPLRVSQSLTRAVVAVDETGDVGFGLAVHLGKAQTALLPSPPPAAYQHTYAGHVPT